MGSGCFEHAQARSVPGVSREWRSHTLHFHGLGGRRRARAPSHLLRSAAGAARRSRTGRQRVRLPRLTWGGAAAGEVRPRGDHPSARPVGVTYGECLDGASHPGRVSAAGARGSSAIGLRERPTPAAPPAGHCAEGRAHRAYAGEVSLSGSPPCEAVPGVRRGNRIGAPSNVKDLPRGSRWRLHAMRSYPFDPRNGSVRLTRRDLLKLGLGVAGAAAIPRSGATTESTRAPSSAGTSGRPTSYGR